MELLVYKRASKISDSPDKKFMGVANFVLCLEQISNYADRK